VPLELFVEDDQSDPTKVLSAYRILHDQKRIQFLIGGSWWLRSIVTVTERDRLPLLSCETMYDKDFIQADTYFILNGRVADWVKLYEPFFRARGLRRGAAVSFTSGFSQTIVEEMQSLFSQSGREFVGDFQYQDLGCSQASSLLLRLKTARPDVVFVDGQPEGLSNLLRRRAELQLQSIPFVGHSALKTAFEQGLVSKELTKNLFFLGRKPPSSDFIVRFQKKFGRPPQLSADLGYYAVHMAVRALKEPSALVALRSGMTVMGKEFVFDQNQVTTGITHQIYRVSEGGEIAPLEGM
jgi:ABC-type branched-subunit amino acid transport system substrate-binding protein